MSDEQERIRALEEVLNSHYRRILATLVLIGKGDLVGAEKQLVQCLPNDIGSAIITAKGKQ